MEIFDAIHTALDAVVDKALTLVIAGFISFRSRCIAMFTGRTAKQRKFFITATVRHPSYGRKIDSLFPNSITLKETEYEDRFSS